MFLIVLLLIFMWVISNFFGLIVVLFMVYLWFCEVKLMCFVVIFCIGWFKLWCLNFILYVFVLFVNENNWWFK